MVRGHVKERDSVVDFVKNQQLQMHSNEPTKPRLQTKGIPQGGKRCQFSGRHTRMSASFVLLRRQSAPNARNEGTSMIYVGQDKLVGRRAILMRLKQINSSLEK